jgi:alanyl-tRNA synthetase
VLPGEIGPAIERLQADAREQKRALTALHGELAKHRASALVASAPTLDAGAADRVKAVFHAVDADAAGLKALALSAASHPGCLILLTSASRPSLVVVARSADVPIAADRLLAALTARFGGRGGGKPELAQGGGLDASFDDIVAAARAHLESRS